MNVPECQPGMRAIRRLGLLLVTGVLAAGCGASAPPTNAPATTAPAAQAALVIDSDVVLGPKNLTDAEKPTKTCVQLSRFAHNEQVVWRVRVIDGGTGKPLDDQALSAVQVKLPDQTLDARYGPHPKNNPLDYFWTTSWTVPEGYPSGTLAYTINATAKDGRSVTWEQFKVAAAELTITDDVRAVIATPVPSPSASK